MPAEIARLCDRHCESQSLSFVGFDFKIEADETWTVLEANPMPGYESYDRRQGHRIARALADLLASGVACPPVPAASRDRTTWPTHDTAPPILHGRDIYEHEPVDDAAGPLFIGQDRRPRCRPFYHPTRSAGE